jgi:hypothetical protein
MLEIAAGLMGMNEQSEMETLGHGDSFFLPDHDNKPREFMNSSRGTRKPSTHLVGRGGQSEMDEKSGTP